MTWVKSLQATIDYTEDHLLDGLTIENIAQQANFQVFTFSVRLRY